MVFLLFGILVLGLHAAVPLLVDDPATAQWVLYDVLAFASVVTIAVGVRRYRPAYRTPWLLLGLGQLANFAGDLAWTAKDPLYLASYGLTALALFLVVRRRTPGWDLATAVDAAVVAVTAGLLSWIFLIAPVMTAADGLVRETVTLAYPLGDLLTLVLAARLLLGATVATPALRLLAGGLLTRLAGDVVYGLQPLLGDYETGGHLDRTWMVGLLLVGAAALHPSMRRLAERTPAAAPDVAPGRLVLLAVASVMAPTVLLVQAARGAPLYVPLVGVSCIVLFLLVLARMAGLVAVQRRMAVTDALTGLRTRRYFEQALRQHERRAQRTGEASGLLLIDVDHFKKINDTYGHHGGDLVLCEVAHRMQELVRAGDMVARYGGEEFVVLLPDTPPDRLDEIAQRLCRGVADAPVTVTDGTTVTVTVSVGSAVLPPGTPRADEVVFAADRALYAAKRSGRNRVVAAGAPA
ncbi:hypothetical protein KRM28CT15_12850 [Krasilnikovia sp. M28-CT-15]